MDLQLRGRTALVLGATRGLGLACAEALAAEGVRVLLNGRDAEHGRATAARLPDAQFVGGDVARDGDRRAILDAATRLGSPDIVVTNAGGPPAGLFEETDLSMWRAAFETNIAGPLELVRALLPAMRQRGFGRVLNITSFVAKELYPNMSLSNSVRVGLTGAMGALAREVAHEGITVNGLLPGLMDTGALQRVIRDRMQRTGASEQAVRDAMASSVPARRLGTAADFGPLCAFLASPLAGYITGQNICIDGGLTKNVV
ncbi:MAG: SDR family oxidoreductase [Burkholderiaceae bacterium]|nr:SDR family oxidoreductase [Burkholderiaceae bacterium]